MKVGLIGGLIGVLMMIGTLGAIVLNQYNNPNSVAISESGFENLIDLERDSVLTYRNSQFAD